MGIGSSVRTHGHCRRGRSLSTRHPSWTVGQSLSNPRSRFHVSGGPRSGVKHVRIRPISPTPEAAPAKECGQNQSKQAVTSDMGILEAPWPAPKTCPPDFGRAKSMVMTSQTRRWIPPSSLLMRQKHAARQRAAPRKGNHDFLKPESEGEERENGSFNRPASWYRSEAR